MKNAIYPGSFDPITNGHLEIIKRGALLFDKLTIAVLINPDKEGLFSMEERVQFIKNAVLDIDNIEVISFSGLLADLVKEKKYPVILKGLRNSKDFAYEKEMDILNKMLDEKVETIYLLSESKNMVISSSAVKQIAKFNGNVKEMVTRDVEEALKKKYNLV
ncbi:MAG: pantetheine-phosphate adenylyltransferase [Sarcina sp.]